MHSYVSVCMFLSVCLSSSASNCSRCVCWKRSLQTLLQNAMPFSKTPHSSRANVNPHTAYKYKQNNYYITYILCMRVCVLVRVVLSVHVCVCVCAFLSAFYLAYNYMLYGQGFLSPKEPGSFPSKSTTQSFTVQCKYMYATSDTI